MKIALCAIVKPTEAEGQCLANLLSSVAEYADGIFITQAGEKPSEYVSSVIKLYGGVESFYSWDNSFANARNYNFSQVSEDFDYIMWFDADDEVDGGELIKDTIEKHPSVDSFSLWYNYAFDEWGNPIVVHHKTRIIRNDGSIKWVGDLHEDFAANRAIESKHIEGIEVNHRTTNERVEEAKKRNLHVARRQKQALPDDPRSDWNLANSLKADGKFPEALKVFNNFLKTSQSDDEKYIARLRKGEILWNLGHDELAVEELQLAIGMKPSYPDAYVQLGQCYYHMGKYDKAISILKQALTLPAPKYEIIVYNPMDYTYTPLKWLAYAYIAIDQPIMAYECFNLMLRDTPKDERLKEIVGNMKKKADAYQKMLDKYSAIKDLKGDRLKRALNTLPADFKSAPMFCNLRNMNFVKEESSGKDLVIMCGYSGYEWTPKIANTKGVGGSEEAVIHLAKGLVKQGWNVEVYNRCGHKEQEFDGVKYKPFWMWNYRDKQDVVILWRHPKMLDYEINCDNIYLDLHDVINDGEFTKKRMKKVSKVFVKSEFHKSLFPSIPDNKFVVVPNGIEYDKFEGKVIKEPFLLVNTSSPDRSLGKLIKLFKKVKERVPEAECEWAYGWDGFENNVTPHSPEAKKWMEEVKYLTEHTEGFKVLGRVSQEETRKMYRRGRIFAYPTEFAEIDCISARKAQAAGCMPVTTDFAALNETVRHGVKLKSSKNKDNWCKPGQFDFSMDDELDEKWVDAIVAELRTPHQNDIEMREDMEQFDWTNIVKVWNDTLVSSGKE